MKFGEIPVRDAVGAILAHSVRHNAGIFKKGRTLSGSDVGQLALSGIEKVFAARLEADDVSEDEAAQRLADALAGLKVSTALARTGRSNIVSDVKGVALVDADRLKQFNSVSETITAACLPPFTLVEAGEMVATVKIIPFGVSGQHLDQAISVISGHGVVGVAPLHEKRVGLIVTQVKGGKASLLRKSEAAIRKRVEGLGSQLYTVNVVSHDIVDLSAAIRRACECHDVVLVFGASAIVDRGDVVPAGLVEAGGTVIHLGMPVDPGNLMMLGALEQVPVIGVPSCARSPKLNGFDWVLARVLAGINVTSDDIQAMGTGGLLKEIASRPAPREALQ